MDKPKFQFLDDTNLFLGNVTGYADKAFANLTGASQATVDVTTAEVAYGMSVGIEKCRQATIRQLHDIYGGYLKIMDKFSVLANMSITDPLKLLEPVLEIVKILTGPYYQAIEIVAELTPKVEELSANLAKIASYQPPKIDVTPSPGTFKLQVGSITMGEIMSGTPNPVTIKKPNVNEIKAQAKINSDQKFQEATASTANTMSTNTGKENTLKFATVNDPKGTGEKSKEINLEELTEIEKQVLGYTNTEHVLAFRLGTLEYTLFGKAFAGLYNERFDRIKAGVKNNARKKAKKLNKNV